MSLSVEIRLVDINEKMVAAWRETFENNPEVQIVTGSMLDQQVDAWVSPTNSRGLMDGGLDAVIKNRLGAVIEQQVQQAIASQYGGVLPVGHATCVPTGGATPKYLISTPTMHSSAEDVSDTMNVAVACAAVFQAVTLQNQAVPGSIQTVAIPGLGANTGKVPVEICADLMWTGYNLFRRESFNSFAEMRKALETELGDLGSTQGISKATPLAGSGGPATFGNANPGSIPSGTGSTPTPTPTTPKGPPPKQAEVDFDDFDDDIDDLGLDDLPKGSEEDFDDF